MKTRFKAYKFYKDGKPLPGFLTVRYGKLLPEFRDECPYNGYIASWPVGKGDMDLSSFSDDTKEGVSIWKRGQKAERVVKVILER